jgi:hypothetical protein
MIIRQTGYRIYSDTISILPATEGSPADTIPDTFFISPGTYAINNETYHLTHGGVYRFSRPGIPGVQRIVFDRNKGPEPVIELLQQLSWVYTYGTPDEDLTVEELMARVLERKVAVGCGKCAHLIQALLSTVNIRSRIVALLSCPPYNGYTDGHTLIEIEENGSWFLYDPVMRCYFSGSGKRLSLLDLVTFMQRKIAFTRVPVSESQKYAVFQTPAYDFGFYFDELFYSEAAITQWYAHIGRLPLIQPQKLLNTHFHYTTNCPSLKGMTMNCSGNYYFYLNNLLFRFVFYWGGETIIFRWNRFRYRLYTIFYRNTAQQRLLLPSQRSILRMQNESQPADTTQVTGRSYRICQDSIADVPVIPGSPGSAVGPLPESFFISPGLYRIGDEIHDLTREGVYRVYLLGETSLQRIVYDADRNDRSIDRLLMLICWAYTWGSLDDDQTNEEVLNRILWKKVHIGSSRCAWLVQQLLGKAQINSRIVTLGSGDPENGDPSSHTLLEIQEGDAFFAYDPSVKCSFAVNGKRLPVAELVSRITEEKEYTVCRISRSQRHSFFVVPATHDLSFFAEAVVNSESNLKQWYAGLVNDE